ncbi:hypothetical protein [Stenotrophomonas maltophilia]|uniref:hypothetical protein n=1 Tax=Stenotrophomonas maltophilia TaxID=40324 RepID=UPI001238BFA0|nr:hypothetical protein [Stenotrophomonas maltophilia]QEU34111.1 hypothetical protein FOB57_13645 [Stenotrophomonas maltophilia]
MQRDDNKTIHLGWIALRVVADADGNAISAHVVLHAEKDLSPLGALTLAQVAEVAEIDLLNRVLGHGESDSTATGKAPCKGHAATCLGSGDPGACGCLTSETATGAAFNPTEYAGMETATGAPAVHVHPYARTATGND